MVVSPSLNKLASLSGWLTLRCALLMTATCRRRGVALVEERGLHPKVVALVVVEEVDEPAAQQIRALKHRGVDKVVVVATRVEDAGLVTAVEAGASGFLRRGQATGPKLVETIRTTAAGDGALPPDLLDRLLGHAGRLQRQVCNPPGLTLSATRPR